MVSLRTARNGVDQCGAARAKVENRDGGSVGRLQKGLILWSREEKLGGSVGIVVQKLHPSYHVAGGELIGKRFRPDQVAPKLRAQMRRVDPAKDPVPVGVVTLAAQHVVASLPERNGVPITGAARRHRSDRGGNPHHFFLQQIGFRVFAEKSTPTAAANERKQIGPRREFLLQSVNAQPCVRGK